MKKKGRRGGQRKPAAVRKRNNLTFRTRDQLRDQLERAAAKTGRSISEEVEHRLTLSLFGEDIVFGDPAMRHIVTLMASTFMAMGELNSGGKPVAEWIKDPDVFRRATFGALYSLARTIPDLTAEQIEHEIQILKRELLINTGNMRAP